MPEIYRQGESEDAGEDKPSHKSHGDDDEAKKDDDADTEDAEVKAPAPKKKKSAGKNKKVPWAANKRFEISKFKFKFPRARTYELIRARSRLYRS